MEKKILLSKEKIIELKNELKELLDKKLPGLSAALEHARQSDLSEDTDDLSLMLEEKEALDDRVAQINDVLSKSEIVDKRACNPNVISIGSTITIERNGKKQNIRIVSSLEADPMKGDISENSPLGKALLTAKVGKSVKFRVKGKTFEYKILEIC